MSDNCGMMPRWLKPGIGALLLCAAACAPVAQPEPSWPPLAKKWYERAQAGFRSLDTEDATAAIGEALKLEPQREEVRELAGRIALAQLDFDQALKHTEGLTSVGALTIRARAFWYSGQVTAAGEVLEVLVADPDVRDPWAQGVVALARNGHGRTPFDVQGEILAVMEMPRLESAAMVVPVELNGNPVLAMISTTTTEVVVDSGSLASPEWVTLRFGQRVQVKDVPALSRDLSAFSRELGAPVKVLLGTHALRHLNATVDYMGRQFVVRTFVPPAPPGAASVSVQNISGGAMVVRSELGTDLSRHFALMLDASSPFAVVLDDQAWERAGVAPARAPIDGHPGVLQGLLPRVQLGGVSVPNVAAVSGVSIAEAEASLGIELDGTVGAGLLNSFRITVTQGGRKLWLEDGPFAGFEPGAEPFAEPQFDEGGFGVQDELDVPGAGLQVTQ